MLSKESFIPEGKSWNRTSHWSGPGPGCSTPWEEFATTTPKPQRLVRSHLDPQYEPAYWVRYWILDSLVAAGAPDLKELAEKVVAQEEEPLVGKLGEAILASKGDAAAWKKIEDGLMDPKLQWATLRALRIVPIPAMFHRINKPCRQR